MTKKNSRQWPRIPVTYRDEWQDRSGARGWKLDTSMKDSTVIASTAYTGEKVPTSVVQLASRTGANIEISFRPMVEEVMHGRILGESIETFLPDTLKGFLPDSTLSDEERMSRLSRRLNKRRLESLLALFQAIGKEGTGPAKTHWHRAGDGNTLGPASSGRQRGMRDQHRIPGNTRIVVANQRLTLRNWKQHEDRIMKLLYSRTSPYSRKVRMMIHEKGLQQVITNVACNPFDKVPELEAMNPLGKVPTLILDDGSSLYDSPVICAYLDTLTPGRLIPESSMERWSVLRWEALCDGVLDATYNIVMEQRRVTQEQSAGWIEQWKSQLSRSLDHIEASIDMLPNQVTLAQLALGAALGYLDFRLSDLDWRHQCPALAAWYGDFSVRNAMQNTRPE